MAYFIYDEVNPATVPNPAAGRNTLFANSLTNNWAMKDSGGAVTDLAPQTYAPDRTLHVANAGASYATIQAAIDAVNALAGGNVPSATNPVLVWVHSGNYVENNNILGVFDCPAHCIIHLEHGVVIQPTNPTQLLLSCPNINSGIEGGGKILGTSAAGGIAVKYSSDDAHMHCDGILFSGWETAIEITGSAPATGTTVSMNHTEFDSTNGTQIKFDAANYSKAEGFVHGIDMEKVTFGPNTVMEGLATRRGTDGRTGIQTGNDLICGMPGNGQSAYFGEGDKTHIGVVMKTNPNGTTGAWNDITATIKAGATDLFPGVAAKNSFYLGSNKPISAWELNLTTAATVGAGDIIAEYWNGAAWIELKHMTYLLDTNLQDADNVTETTGKQLLFFENTTASQAMLLLDGDTKYWVRLQVNTAITVVPTCFQNGVFDKPSSTSIEPGIGIINVGTHRVRTTIPSVHLRLTDDGQGASPSNERLQFSTNVDLTPIDNRFQNGAIDEIGGVIYIPSWLDTSDKIKFTLFWAVAGTPTGNVNWEIYYTPAKVGDVLSAGLTETNLNHIEIISVASNDIIKKLEVEFDVSGLKEGELLGFLIRRDATGGNLSDTLAGNVYIAALNADGMSIR